MSYAGIFSFGFGCVGFAIGASYDTARRCGDSTNLCDAELAAANATSNTAVDALLAERLEEALCDGADDDSLPCAIASIYSLFQSTRHLLTLASTYPSGFILLTVGSAVGLQLGSVIDHCFDQQPIAHDYTYKKKLN